MPSKHLLKRGQVLLDTSDFDPAIMRGIDMQCHVLHIDNARACTLDKASWATVQILRQAEAARSKWTQSDGSNMGVAMDKQTRLPSAWPGRWRRPSWRLSARGCQGAPPLRAARPALAARLGAGARAAVVSCAGAAEAGQREASGRAAGLMGRKAARAALAGMLALYPGLSPNFLQEA